MLVEQTDSNQEESNYRTLPTESDEKLSKQVEVLVDHFEALQSFFEVYNQYQGLTHEQLENIYALAQSLVSKGNYEYAEEVFFKLTLFGSEQARFWSGLGKVRRQQKKYTLAADAFSVASMLDPTDGHHWFDIAQCYFISKNYSEAAMAISSALKYMAGEHAHYQAAQRLDERITQLINKEK